MSEMVERVARIMCSVDNGWNKNCDDRWTHYVPMARAAIEAMREPTEGMVKAVEQAEVASGCVYAAYEHIDWDEAWAVAIDATLND